MKGGAVLAFLVLVGITAILAEEHYQEYIDYRAPPHYKYDYGVRDPHTHDFKNQWEHREGKEVKGVYTLLQPDGRKRIVTYRAGKHGADYKIKYEGKSEYGGIGEGGEQEYGR